MSKMTAQQIRETFNRKTAELQEAATERLACERRSIVSEYREAILEIDTESRGCDPYNSQGAGL